MGKFTLNAEQAAFVSNKDGNVLVSASAGSGKTTTMISKLVDLIVNQNVPVTNLLVVTFTEAAAQEMKQKLYFELVDKIKSGTFSDDKLASLYTELDNIMVADIGTLHSVCKKIVTKYFYAVSIEPNFKIIADVEYQSMFNTALDNVFNTYVESGDEEFYATFEAFNEKRNFGKLKSVVTTLYNFFSEQVNAEGWFYRVCDQITNPDLNINTCAKYLYEYYHSNLCGYIDDFNALLDQAKNISQKQTEIVSSYLNLALKIKNTKNFAELHNLVYGSRNLVTLSSKVPDANYYEKLKFTAQAFKKCLDQAKENFVSDNLNLTIENSVKLKGLLLKLYEITVRVEEEFSRLKQNSGALDFSDLQKLTIQILQDDKIREELKQNYKYIFVDEYQDTNQIQEEIILSLTSGSNLNMIGDVKQSIYAFRQCKPEIFLNKYNLFNSDGVNNKLLKFNENYRSAKNIIDFANMIFDAIITPNTIGINYAKDARLICKSNDIGKVKLCLIDEPDKKASEEKPDKIKVEAQVVLNEILSVINKPYLNLKTNQVENINYKDIAILSRDSKDFVIELYKLLSDHKIPVNATLKQSIFSTSEVSLIYSLLKLIANETCEVELATVLHSFVFNVSNDELAQIKLEGTFDCFYDNAVNYRDFGTNSALIGKIDALFAELALLRHKLKYYSVSEVAEDFIVRYDIKNHLYALPDGAERVTNLEVFCELLKNEMFNFNLNRCLEFLDSLKEKDDFSISNKATENSVKILTMHRSKGLEYPCVILCNLGKSFNRSAFRADMVVTDELGIGINFRDTIDRVEYNTIQKKANILNKNASELNEQIRLLYVAITRAKNFLTIVGTYDFSNYELKKNRSIKSATNFLDLIFKGIDEKYNANFANFTSNFTITKNDCEICEVNLLNPYVVNNQFEDVNVQIDLSCFNASIVNSIVKNVESNTFSKDVLIATKNSVSGLMEEENYVNNSETDLSLQILSEPEDNESLKLGTAYHTVMQNINYREPLNFDALITKLVSSGKIEGELANKIVKSQIENAYNTISKLLKPTTKVLCEQQFLLKAPYSKLKGNGSDVNVLIQGVVDLILVDDNHATIIDFKTNKTSRVQDLINKYGLQLNCYAQAVAEGLNKVVDKKMLYLFHTNKLVEV